MTSASPFNGKWVCGKCARKAALGHDDGQIPEHHRTCPLRSTPTLQPGDEHDTTPERLLFGDEQAAPGSDDA